jgi:hypothetical protein
MGLLIMGKMMLVGFMMVVMGVPMLHYLKRDRAYEATEGQPEEVRLKVWYGS